MYTSRFFFLLLERSEGTTGAVFFLVLYSPFVDIVLTTTRKAPMIEENSSGSKKLVECGTLGKNPKMRPPNVREKDPPKRLNFWLEQAYYIVKDEVRRNPKGLWPIAKLLNYGYHR